MKYFYKDLELDVPETVYYPREDSELMAKVLEGMRLENKRVLEIGCGSGILSIVMAKQGAQVTAVDINEDAVETTKLNAEKNSARLTALVSNMFEHVDDKFDLIVFNPPYLSDDTDLDVVAAIRNEGIEHLKEDNILRQWGGGPTGREIIGRFFKSVAAYLAPDSTVVIGISSLTGEEEVLSIIRKAGLNPQIARREKIPWEELIVVEALF
jgi:release factor glutamine methyltransferase